MKRKKFSPKNLKISASLPEQARKAPFWKRVLELLSAPSRKKRGVNVSHLSGKFSEGNTVVVPDKVLGSGKLEDASGKFTVAAMSFSQSARKMIESAGGKAVSLVEAAKAHPTGKGIVIIK